MSVAGMIAMGAAGLEPFKSMFFPGRKRREREEPSHDGENDDASVKRVPKEQ